MRFVLEIELGNEAMQSSSDISAVLRKVADSVDRSVDDRENEYGEYVAQAATKIVLDINGNTVGKWEVIEDRPKKVIYDDDLWPPPMR